MATRSTGFNSVACRRRFHPLVWKRLRGFPGLPGRLVNGTTDFPTLLSLAAAMPNQARDGDVYRRFRAALS